MLIGGVFVLAAAAILVVAMILNRSQPARLPFVAQPAGAVAGQQVPDEGQPRHIPGGTQAAYRVYPPTSGPHYGQPDAPVAWQSHGPLVEGQYLHNLEHGGIAILYHCPTGCEALRTQLENYVDNLAPEEPQFHEVKVVLTPYTHGMGDHRIALLAWHWIEFLDSYEQQELTRFYEIHVGHGPEQIP